MNLKNVGKVVTSKFVGTGPSFYKKRIYRDAVSQSVEKHCSILHYTILCKRILYTIQYTLTQCTKHTPHWSYYAAITLTTSVGRLYLH